METKLNKIWQNKSLWLGLLLLALVSTQGYCQQNQDITSYTHFKGKLIVQLSGVVLEAGTQIPLMGVHVYSPRYGRGTSSDPYGFFSDVFLEGDSVLVSAVGFKKQWVLITADQGDEMTIVIELEEDTTYLQEIEVTPYPTERQLRETILALSDPDVQQQMALARSMDPDVMAALRRNLPNDPAGNFRWANEQRFYQSYNNGVPGIPLLNPFAWGELIKSIKRGDFKRRN